MLLKCKWHHLSDCKKIKPLEHFQSIIYYLAHQFTQFPCYLWFLDCFGRSFENFLLWQTASSTKVSYFCLYFSHPKLCWLEFLWIHCWNQSRKWVFLIFCPQKLQELALVVYQFILLNKEHVQAPRFLGFQMNLMTCKNSIFNPQLRKYRCFYRSFILLLSVFISGITW